TVAMEDPMTDILPKEGRDGYRGAARAPFEAADPAEPGAVRAGKEASRERPEPDRRPDHGLRRLDDVRLPAHPLVRRLDRLQGRALPVRPADDDRLAGGDLPLDVRDDQPEPGRRQAPGRREPGVEDCAGGGPAES